MRTTIKELENKIKLLNEMTKNPLKTWKKIDGVYKAQIGNYFLYQAYGGCQIHQITTEGGGVRTVITGFHSKSDLWNLLDTYINGVMDCKINLVKTLTDNQKLTFYKGA